MSAKTIHFIRHAQSEHNARALDPATEAAARIDPALRDARLTSLGRQQASALTDEITTLHDIELVVTSPLTRAIQTTLAAFAHHPAPRIVHSLHRERLESFCDVGRGPLDLATDFPLLRFDHLDDPWWHVLPDHAGPFALEPMDALQQRVSEFADWLSGRTEQTIAVVGHGTFLRMLTDVAFDNAQRVMTRF